MVTEKNKIRIQPRDIAFLSECWIYKVETRQSISTLPLFSSTSPEAIKSFISRHRRAGTIASAPYVGGSYYYLTKFGGAIIGKDDVTGEPLKPDPFIRAYSILSFCRLQEEKRTLINPDEFKRHFPDCWQPGRRINNFFIDTAPPKPRLSYIRVDFGRTSKANQILAACRRDISKMMNHSGFVDLKESGELQMTVITAMQVRKQRLDRMIQLLDEPLEIPVKTVAIESLRDVIAPLKY